MTRLGRAAASRPPLPGARAGLSFLLLLLLLLSPLAAQAAVYTFSGSSFPSCSNGSWSQSGSTWTCNGATTLAAGDSISPSGAITVLAKAGITLSGNNAIGTASASVNLATEWGDLTTSGSGTVIRGNLTAGSGTITLTSTTVNGTVTKTGGGGSITITGGSITGAVNASSSGISASGGTVFGSSVTASGAISLAGGSVAGNVSGNNGVTATGGVIFSGSVTSSNGSISLAGGSVAGNVNGNNGVTASGGVIFGGSVTAAGDITFGGGSVAGNVNGKKITATGGTTFGGNITATGGEVSLTGGSVVGQVSSNCCAVTINNTDVGGNVTANSGTISLTGGSVGGNVHSNCCVVATNGTNVGGNVSSNSNSVAIVGGTIGGNVSSNGCGSGYCISGGAIVNGNVTMPSWQNPEKIVGPGSAVHGNCSPSDPGTDGGSCNGGSSGGSSGSDPDRFQAIDEAYAFPASATQYQSGRIYTKLAGVAFKLNVAALSSSGTIEEDYVVSGKKWLQVKLVDSSGDCDPDGACNNCVGLAPVASQIMEFDSAHDGQRQSADFTVATAWRELAVVMRECTNATCSGFTTTPAACATDQFSVRPTGATITANSATQTSSDGDPKFRAGEDTFSIAVRVTKGVNNDEDVGNYDGTLKIGNPEHTIPASGANPGAFINTASNIGSEKSRFEPAAGVSTSTTSGTFTYGEVGVFTLPGSTDATSARGIWDDTWTAVDRSSDDCVAGSYSNVKVDGKYGCFFGLTANHDFGRFIPHHFGVSGSLVTRSDLQTAETQTTPFTYMGEPMKLTLTVTAYNKQEGVTQNYEGTLAKLGASTLDTGENWFSTGCTGSTQCMGLGAAADDAAGLSGRLAVYSGAVAGGTASQTSDWAAGVGTFDLHLILKRAASPDGPFAALKLGGRPRDADGVTLRGADLNLDATTGDDRDSGPDGTSERGAFDFSTQVRFGRLRLTNAYGSVSPLEVPAEAQYWSGNSWVLNKDDTLTSLGAFSASYASCNVPGEEWVVPTLAGALDKGKAKIAVDTKKSPGSCFLTLAVPVWLKGNWGGNAGYTANPSAKVTFGVFSPEHKRTIHIRELY